MAAELIAMMLAQSLRESGWNAVHWTLDQVTDLRNAFSKKAPDVVILSAMPPSALLPARALCRQLRRIHPKVEVVLAIWTAEGTAEKIKERLRSYCADTIVTTIQEAKEQLQQRLSASHLAPASGIQAEQLADQGQLTR